MQACTDVWGGGLMGGLLGSTGRMLDQRVQRAVEWESARWYRAKPPSTSFSAYDPNWGHLPKRWCALHLAKDRCWKKR